MTRAPSSTHEARVADVASQLRALAARRAPAHIDKGGVHHFVPLPGDRRFAGARVDASALRHVLEVDPRRRVCSCEPGVPFRELVEATLAHGLLPTVVPELEGITVGGAVAGCSVESMSFRFGGFHDSCLEYEVVAGTGEVLVCSPEREPLAFHMLHGSYGTLGILARATFRLVPAKPFVRLEYRRLPTAAAFRDELFACTRDPSIDFLDGIVHGAERFVLCVGRFVDHAPERSDYRGTEIFYRATAERSEDFLSTADYCFRYDTECHWMTATVPPLQWRPVRRLAGRWLLGSTNLIRWSNALAPLLALKRRPDVVCDYFLPARTWTDFFSWYERTISHYPLWVVPYSIPEPYPWIDPAYARGMGDTMFFDCAVYGRRNDAPEVDLSAVLEEKTFELNGIKTLISRNHYSPERFWTIYDRARYREAKERLDPNGLFPDIYEKFHRAR